MSGVSERLADLSPKQLSMLIERLAKAAAQAAPARTSAPLFRQSGRRPAMSGVSERLADFSPKQLSMFIERLAKAAARAAPARTSARLSVRAAGGRQ